MPDGYMYPEETIRETGLRPRSERIIKWLIVAVCIAAAAELIWLLVITPFMPFSRINVTAIEGLSRNDVLQIAGINSQSSFIAVDTGSVEMTLKSLPQIENAKVLKRFPDRLEIILAGRKAAALTLAEINGLMTPVFFDSSGVIFQIGSGGGLDASSELPVISGLVIENPAPGMRLPAMFNSFFESLDVLAAKEPELLKAVSEIRISRKSFDGFDLVLYPVHKQIRVRLSELNEDLLRYTLLMVDVLAEKEPGVDYVDFRAGMASYTPKEAFSE
ncbi:MAG: FtsQ-type POTRA domain-containing protein [Treponema sp.]|jgi:cell division protein FtsQ|nr:FtsQ-type POTRA domain-containing protein [Treponema sp.]